MYELMIILKPLLPDDVRKAIHKTIVNTIAEMGGEVKDVDVWGKRYLAYKINGYSEGYYIVYQYDLPAAQVAEFSRQMGLKQEVIRFLINTVEKPELIHKSLKKKEIEI
jgi:small subunit ribosomal protein S6